MSPSLPSMRGHSRLRSCLLLVLGMLLLLPGAPRTAAAQQTLHIVMAEWRPYTSRDLPAGGALAEMTDIAFSLSNIATRFSVVPWPRAVSMLESGEADGLLAVHDSERNKHRYHLSTPLLTVDTIFARLRSLDIPYASLDDLIGWRIGTVKNSTYAAKLTKRGIALVEEAPDEQRNYQKLLSGRIDIMLDTRETLERMLEGMPKATRDELVLMEPPFESNTLHMAFAPTPRGEILCNILNRGIAQIRQKGVHAAILEKHHIARSTSVPARTLD